MSIGHNSGCGRCQRWRRGSRVSSRPRAGASRAADRAPCRGQFRRRGRQQEEGDVAAEVARDGCEAVDGIAPPARTGSASSTLPHPTSRRLNLRPLGCAFAGADRRGRCGEARRDTGGRRGYEVVGDIDVGVERDGGGSVRCESDFQAVGKRDGLEDSSQLVIAIGRLPRMRRSRLIFASARTRARRGTPSLVVLHEREDVVSRAACRDR